MCPFFPADENSYRQLFGIKFECLYIQIEHKTSSWPNNYANCFVNHLNIYII
jgi:hypothetical protein